MTSEAGTSYRYPVWGEAPQSFRPGWHPLWIAVMVAGFIVWWPIGLAILFYTLWSRKMGCWKRHGDFEGHWQNKMVRLQDKMDRMRMRMERFGGAPSSGNRAFDDYRTETLRRLEEEQREFKDFLDRLRHAKDKAEFDQFMSERRGGPQPPAASPQP